MIKIKTVRKLKIVKMIRIRMRIQIKIIKLMTVLISITTIALMTVKMKTMIIIKAMKMTLVRHNKHWRQMKMICQMIFMIN